jgi:hypothetical protein
MKTTFRNSFETFTAAGTSFQNTEDFVGRKLRSPDLEN